MEAIFMNMESNETKEPYKYVLNLSQLLDSRSPRKYVVLQYLSIYYT